MDLDFFLLFLKLVHLGELRHVCLGIWACLVIEEDRLACFGCLSGPVSLPSSFLTSEGLAGRKKANIKDSVYTLWFKVR